jgi:hypothetical protein
MSKEADARGGGPAGIRYEAPVTPCVADIPDEIRDAAIMLDDLREGSHAVGVFARSDIGRIWAIRRQDDDLDPELTREPRGGTFRRIAWAANLREVPDEEARP